MARKCHGCKITENYKYWSDSPATKNQFFKIMTSNFEHHLQLSKKFMECFKHKLAPRCTLVGASKNKWRVKLSNKSTTEDEEEEPSSVAFSEGWNQFVRDNGVDLYDFLLFRFVEDSTFEVTVFDATGCEREGTHFATNSSLSSPRTACNSMLHRHSNSDDSAAEFQPEEDQDTECDPSRKDDESDDDDNEVKEKRGKGRRSSSNQGKKGQAQKYFISNRRKLTRAEQQRATKMALKYVSKNRRVPLFKITLRASHVYHGFHLTIPKTWAMKHMPDVSHEVELRVPKDRAGRSWIVGCSWMLTSVRQCQLRAKWSTFVWDNNLEEHDACVFELISATPTFNVHIFRAVDRIVPLSVSKRLV